MSDFIEGDSVQVPCFGSDKPLLGVVVKHNGKLVVDCGKRISPRYAELDEEPWEKSTRKPPTFYFF